jgi:hypothetical protein
VKRSPRPKYCPQLHVEVRDGKAVSPEEELPALKKKQSWAIYLTSAKMIEIESTFLFGDKTHASR